MSSTDGFNVIFAQSRQELTEKLVALELDQKEAAELVRGLLKISPEPFGGDWVSTENKEKGFSWSVRRSPDGRGFVAERRRLVTGQ